MIKLTKKQQQFCDTYEKYGGNVALICADMNIKYKGYESYMNNSQVKEYISCAMQRTRDSIVSALPHIQRELLKMYNMGTTDDKVKIEIAKQFMDRAGLISDKNINVNVNINTQISERAKKIMVERQRQNMIDNTIETTAKPVVVQVCDVLPQFSTIDNTPADQQTSNEELT